MTQEQERAQPVAWQERQRIVGGEWSNWYIVPKGLAQLKGARTEVMNGAEYEYRPLYAAPQPNAELADGWMLAKEHAGWKVDYAGLLGGCQRVLKHRGEAGNAEMLRQLQGHLRELGQRWYAGDVAVVDEILQLYCIEQDLRPTPPTLNAIKDE